MRFSGKVGFVMTRETSADVWEPRVTERTYYGDVLARKVRFENGESTNSNLTIGNDISIVADKFAKENLGYMRYVTLGGRKWTVTSATIAYPRITLVLGGLWNEQTEE